MSACSAFNLVHVNVQNYDSLIDDRNNIAMEIEDEWSVISHVRLLNVSLHWDYHVWMVGEIIVSRSEEMKLLFFCSQEESCYMWQSLCAKIRSLNLSENINIFPFKIKIKMKMNILVVY